MGLGLFIKSLVFLLPLAVFSLGGLCLAADYTADLVREEDGKESKGRLYVAGSRIRMEMTVQDQEMITLIDRDKEKVYLLRPGARVYLERPYGVALATALMTAEGLARIGRVERLGSEELDGYSCRKLKVVYHNEQNGEALIWRAEELDFPLKIVTESARGRITTRYTNVTLEESEAALFELPEGYKKLVPRQAPAPKTR